MKFHREAFFVAPDLLNEHSGFDAVEICEILIRHHLATSDDQDPLLDRPRGDDLQFRLLGSRVGHVDMMANSPKLIV
jgi:hypothetical protein